MNPIDESSSRQLSWPHYSYVSLRQMIYNRKITKTHNDTGQTNKYSKQKDKINRSSPCFCHKMTFYYEWKAHSLLSLSLWSLLHRHTYSLQKISNVMFILFYYLPCTLINIFYIMCFFFYAFLYLG